MAASRSMPAPEDPLRPLLRLLRSEDRWNQPLPIQRDSDFQFEEVNAWSGGASFKEAVEEEERSWRFASDLWAALRKAPSFDARRRNAAAILEYIDYRLAEPGGQPPLAWFSWGCDVRDLFVCGQTVRAVVDVVMKRNHFAFEDDFIRRITPGGRTRAATGPFVHALQSLAVGLLREADQPLDEWHQASALGYLLAPKLASLVVSFLYWHPPPPDGQSDRERQYASAVGATDKTERLGLKAKRDLQRRTGARPRRPTTGPPRGSHHAASAAQEDFERYLLARTKQGMSAGVLRDDAELQRLYGELKRDHAAVANERIIQHHVRKLRPKSGR